MPQLPLDHKQALEYASSLDNIGVIQLTGVEKAQYLQGQVTADIEQLTNEAALLACHCDFKGKIWSVFYTVLWHDSILLLTHKSVLDKSMSELNKYGVFAKVDITDQTANWQITGGCGSNFETALKEVFDKLPSGDRSVLANDFGLVMSLEQPQQRYLTLQPKQADKQLSVELNDDGDLWEIMDIRAGLGDIREETTNEYVPQMLNLQALGAIDFEKGCYMGQEVVARTKYLGRNKRAGFILKAQGETKVRSGEQLEHQLGENWRPSGKILRSGMTGGVTWVFAILSNETEMGATFRLKSAPDTIFVAQALPYLLQ